MTPLQLAVRAILERAAAYDWSVQGFGLLRLYMGREGRLHVWAPCLRYDGVSVIHDHSWDLHSTIVSGRLVNRRYVETQLPGSSYLKRKLVTGYNTRFIAPSTRTYLVALKDEVYLPGGEYAQKATEIHETIPDPYTVTFMQRYEDTDGLATVYWPVGSEWGTAKPRPATPEEVKRVTKRALELFP